MNAKFAVLFVAGFAFAIFTEIPQARSQTVGTLGTVTNIGEAQTCLANRGFDQQNSTFGTPGMTCYPATLSSCPGNADIRFVYGVEVLPGITPSGTIVFLAGDGGKLTTHTATRPFCVGFPGCMFFVLCSAFTSCVLCLS